MDENKNKKKKYRVNSWGVRIPVSTEENFSDEVGKVQAAQNLMDNVEPPDLSSEKSADFDEEDDTEESESDSSDKVKKEFERLRKTGFSFGSRFN